MRRMVIFLLFVALCLTLSCGTCQKGPTRIEELIPGNARAALVLPRPAELCGDLRALVARFSAGPVGIFLNQAMIQLQNRVGFDPLDAQEWKRLGLDGARPLGLVVTESSQAVLLLPLAEAEVFEASLRERARQWLGVDAEQSASHSGVKVREIGNSAGGQFVPALRWALAGKFALLASGRVPPEALARCASLPQAENLAAAPWFDGLRGEIEAETDLWLALGEAGIRTMAQDDPQLSSIRDGLLLALRMEERGFGGKLFAGIREPLAQRLAGLGDGAADAQLERMLPPNTIVTLKASLNARRLLEWALELEPQARAQYQQNREALSQALAIDPEALLDNLSGSGVLGVFVRDPKALAEAVRQGPAPSAAGAVGLVGLLSLKKGSLLASALEHLVSSQPPERAVLQKIKAGDLYGVAVTGPDGLQARLAVDPSLAGFCLGDGCEDELSRQMKSNAPVATPKNRSAQVCGGGQALSLRLNFAALRESLSRLDASDLGGDAMTRMMLGMAQGALANLGDAAACLRFLPRGVLLAGWLDLP